MKKILLTLSLFLLIPSFLQAQQSTFEKGSAVLDLSIGSPTSSECVSRAVIVPPITLTLDFGGPSGFIKSKKKKNNKSSKIANKEGKGAFGFGGIIGFYADDCWSWKDNYYYGGNWYDNYHYHYDANVYNIIAAFRFSFHIEPIEKMDLYLGILMGGRFRIWDYNEDIYGSYSGNTPVGSKFCFGPFTGIRYYFGDVFGVKAEFSVDTGSGFPNASGGLVFKLK